jgi:adenylate cyclase
MFTRDRLLSAAYILAVAVGALVLAALLHMPHSPEHWSADLRTALLSKELDTQHKRIALIYVTDNTLAPFPYTAPTDRQLMADLVRAVDAAGPKAIGIDFILDRPTEPAKDESLLKAIREARAPVVLGAIGDEGPGGERERNFEADFLAKTQRPAGHFFFGDHHQVFVISDNVVRTIAAPNHGSPSRKSLAELLSQADGGHPAARSAYIAWLRPPKDGAETFLTLSAETILGRNGSSPIALGDLLKDKIVLIGGNFFDRDQHLTPFSVISEHRYPGLFVHAQILAQLIDERSLADIGKGWQFLIILVAACVGFWTGRHVGQGYLFVELASVAGLILIGILAFSYLDLIFPYTGPLLAWLAGASGGHYSRRVHT